MPHYGSTDSIHVQAKGSTPTAFVSATFKANINTVAKTGPAAKEAAKERIAAIWEVLKAFGPAAGIDTDRLRTTFAVDSSKEHDRTTGELRFLGYKAAYSITFTAKNVLEATRLHDALTSIEGVESPSPVFNINESPEIYAQAFKVAADAARVKFRLQCEALGLDPNAYEPATWTIEEEQQHGKTLSVGNGPKASAVGMEPGKATLAMTVTFVFVAKKGSTIAVTGSGLPG
jgi:uncharacterized protein YggE